MFLRSQGSLKMAIVVVAIIVIAVLNYYISLGMDGSFL